MTKIEACFDINGTLRISGVVYALILHLWVGKEHVPFPAKDMIKMGVPGAVGSSSKAKAMQNFLFDCSFLPF